MTKKENITIFMFLLFVGSASATTQTLYSVKLPSNSNSIVAANGMFSGGEIRPLPKQILCSSKAEANALKASFSSLGMDNVQVSARSLDSSKAPKAPVILRKGNGSLQFNYSVNPESISSSTEEFRQEAFRFEGAARQASRSLASAQGNPSFSERIAGLTQEIQSLAPDQKTSYGGFLMYEKGRLMALDKKPQEQVVATLLPVARGEVPASAWHRDNAALKIAKTWRYGVDRTKKISNQREKALAAYLEVREFAQAEGVRSEAAVECVALTMEAVKDRKVGKWVEVEREAVRSLNYISLGDKAHRAVIDLMLLESFYYSGQYERSAEKAQQFFEAYPDQKRELYMARITAALACNQLGDKDKAKELLDKNVAEAPKLPKKGEVFAADPQTGELMNPRSMSLQWLILMARNDKRGEDETKYLELFKADYPEIAATLKSVSK